MNGDPHPRPSAPDDPFAVLFAVLGAVRVLPVVTIDDADDSVALVTALVAGGLATVEITLRTAVAVEAIRRSVSEVPGAVVGAGTVMSVEAAIAVIDAGARFIVSPGLDAAIVEAGRKRGVAVIPGIATATEMMQAAALGVDVVKLFPAELVGGPAMVTALSAVWPDVRFVPTGGIQQDTAPGYLALTQVLAVGGTWMVPRDAVTGGDWTAVEHAAAAAALLGGSDS